MGPELRWKMFEGLVKRGLKISHGTNLDILPEHEMPSLIPRAPVAFAYVTDIAAVDAPTNLEIKTPALIPLPMNKFSVEAYVYSFAGNVHLYFKANWFVRFVKPSHFCTFMLLVPGPDQGKLDTFKVEIPDCSNPDVEPCCNMLDDDVYLIRRKQVHGGAEVRGSFHCKVILPPTPSQSYSFKIPLCFPFYSKGFCGEKQFQRCKIKLFVSAIEGLVIRDFSLNYPYKVMMKTENFLNVLQESGGANLEWPYKVLVCSFRYEDKKATICDDPTDEMLEPAEKKPRLGTETP